MENLKAQLLEIKNNLLCKVKVKSRDLIEIIIFKPAQVEQFDVDLMFLYHVDTDLLECSGLPSNSLTAKVNKFVNNGSSLLERVEFIIKNYGKVLGLEPSCLEMYIGESSAGATIRKYCIIADPVENKDSDSEDDAEYTSQDEDEEDAEYWERQRQQELDRLELEKSRLSQQKRLEYEQDPALFDKKIQVSKKEIMQRKQAANKQGVRMRKTGPKRKKYTGEGASEKK
jgi:hypothetical protein